jgi:hypothetical protein
MHDLGLSPNPFQLHVFKACKFKTEAAEKAFALSVMTLYKRTAIRKPVLNPVITEYGQQVIVSVNNFYQILSG